jgi:hypothetical protein
MIERKKRVFRMLVLVLSAALPVTAFAEHVPTARSGEVDYQFRINIAKDYGELEPMAELTGRIEENDYRYTSATLGGYYRVHRNLKLGAFYRLQSGARHDDDWIDTNPGWEWRDTMDRLEQVLILDASPRFLLDSLPGENWVFMLKNRYFYNTWNRQQSLMVRPGLTYVHLRDREPVFNLGLQYGFYFPLNFSDALIYEHDPYLSFIYHLNTRVKLELFGAYRTRVWTSSEDIAAAGEGDYEVSDRVIILGTGLVLRF